MDFAASPISVTFAAGAQYRRVAVPVVRDSQTEGNEQFQVELSLAANAPAGAIVGTRKTAMVTILDVPNTPPIATAREVVVLEDHALNLKLTGEDNEGDGLSFTVVNSPSHGTLTGSAPSLSYRPNPNFNGIDSFTFKAKEDLHKGLAAEAAGDFDKALNLYASSWDNTTKAIEQAAKTK